MYHFLGDPSSQSLRLHEVILDESSQVPAYVTYTLLHTFPTIQKLVLVGDEKQLPPFGVAPGLEVTSAWGVLKKTGPQPVFLDLQYRMPKPLSDILSRAAYQGQLRTIEAKDVPQSCIQWVNVSGREAVHPSNYSKHNDAEADAVFRLLTTDLKERTAEVVVLCFYKSQVNRIAHKLKASKIPTPVATVDSFQGRESAVVIVSLVLTERVTLPFRFL